MEIKFNCTGTERKRLAQAIGTILGARPEYQFMPTCAYKIGQHILDKDGTLHFTETRCYTDEVGELLKELEAHGIVRGRILSEDNVVPCQDLTTAGYTAESLGEERNELTITMPLDFFDETVFANLDRILENKGTLIKHALGTDSLKYTVTDTAVEFPWFKVETEHDADAYSKFISALCDMAKNQKRINNKPDTSDNEKYTFRCFLLRLGFIGTEYKVVRKVLLRKLSGSSAFRNGGANDAVSE